MLESGGFERVGRVTANTVNFNLGLSMHIDYDLPTDHIILATGQPVFALN